MPERCHNDAMSNEDIAILVPEYNEARVVGDVVRDLREHVGHVICVDDGSEHRHAADRRPQRPARDPP